MTDVRARTPDERIYTYRAVRLANDGFGAYRGMFASYDADPRQWIYPSPIRIVHEVLFAAVMKLTGVQDGRAGAATSWLFSLFSIALAAWLGIRFLNPWVGLAAASFMTFSFAELSMSRRAWQDTTLGFLCLLLVYLTCEIARRPRHVSLHIAFAAVETCCLLTKESGLIACGLCSLWLIGVMVAQERSWRLAAIVVSSGIAAGMVTIGCWIGLAGNVRLALSSVGHSFRNGTGEFGKQYFSGPWYQFFYLLWIVGPLTAAMAAAGLLVAGVSGRPVVHHVMVIRDPRGAGMVSLMTAGFMSFAAFGPNLQFLRVVSPANGTYCLLAGLGLCYLASAVRVRLAASVRRFAIPAAVAAVLLFAGVRDYRAYTHVIVDSGMQEISVFGIRELMGR